jgi:predicted transcriptional regulator
MQYRDRAEIIRQILEVANGAVDITRTKLMYKAFLSYTQMKEYLMLLTERDLLSYDSITHTYKTTEKGLTSSILQSVRRYDEGVAASTSSTTICTQIISQKSIFEVTTQLSYSMVSS